MLEGRHSTHDAPLIRYVWEIPQIATVSEMQYDTESRQMLRRLVKYRSPRRVCEILDVDEDALDALLNDDAPWPPGIIDGVREAMAGYDVQDSRVETQQAVGSCDASDSDVPLTHETTGRDATDVLAGPTPAPAAETRKPAPVVHDRQAQLRAITSHIYAQCERAIEILARNDVSDHDDLRRLRKEILALMQFTTNARTETESEAGAIAYANATAHRIVRKIDEEVRTGERTSGGWWQSLKEWLRN